MWKTEKLDVTPSDVKGAVEALSFVFAECAKNNINEIDFMDTLLVLAFPKEINEGLSNVSFLNFLFLCKQSSLTINSSDVWKI